MLPRLNSRLRAGLDSHGARVSFCRGWPLPRIVHELAIECDRPAAELQDVIGALGACLETLNAERPVAGLYCDVVVADTWVAYEILRGDLGELSSAAADEVVRASLADTLGLKADDLVVRWQRQGEQRQLACGVPRKALEQLRAVLEPAGVRLGTVEGEFVRTFNARRESLAAQRAVLAVVRDAGTQFGLVVERGLGAVRFESATRNALDLQAEAVGLVRCAGLEVDDAIRFVADAAPDAPLPEAWMRPDGSAATAGPPRRLDLDLSMTRPRVSPIRRATLALGTAAAVGAALHLQSAFDAREHFAAEQSQLQAALNEARGARVHAPTPAEVRTAKAAAAVLRELTVPWPALMATFEAAAGGTVALLAVEPASHRNEVRLTAEAKSSTAMLDYLDALRGGTLSEVTLVSHQVQAQTPGTPIRFQAKALWTRSIRTAHATP